MTRSARTTKSRAVEPARGATHLIFRVGPHDYRVVVTRNPLYLEPGEPEVLGLCDGDSRTIFINGWLVPPAARIDTLLHELAHAWRFACPGTKFGDPDENGGGEDGAEFFATVAKGAFRDLNAQGGEAALRALQRVSVGAPELRYVADDDDAPQDTPDSAELEYVPIEDDDAEEELEAFVTLAQSAAIWPTQPELRAALRAKLSHQPTQE